ncbi:MAG: hypothetical protein ACXVGG_14240 [Mycobacteriaceae bacterium]
MSTRRSYTTDTVLDVRWFDLDAATLIATDEAKWDGHNLVSLATGSPSMRETLYCTADGEHVLETNNSDDRSAALGVSYRRVSPENAETWLRRQDLRTIADVYFPAAQKRGPGVQA